MTENDILEQNSDLVRIFLGADEEDIVFLTVCIQSLVQNASSEHLYDITVLSQSLRQDAAEMLASIAADFSYISIHVQDISEMTAAVPAAFKTAERVPLALYFPLFVPLLAKGRVLCTSIKYIFLEDIYKLYCMDISEYYAAVRNGGVTADMESGFFENTGFRWGRKTVPHYASGVILLDIDALHRDFSPESLMKEAEKKGQMCSVQELLYSLCGDRVCFLAARWSRDWIDSDLNTAHYDCSEASEHPAAICFSGSVKPWHMEGRIRQTSRYFWKYADVCPLGEAIRLMYREDCRRAVRNYAKQCKRYLRLLILSKITWGDTRKFYKEQTESARCCIKTTLEIMNKER